MKGLNFVTSAVNFRTWVLAAAALDDILRLADAENFNRKLVLNRKSCSCEVHDLELLFEDLGKGNAVVSLGGRNLGGVCVVDCIDVLGEKDDVALKLGSP